VIDDVKYAGRLKNYYLEWKSLTDDSLILETILGYKIPFLKKPCQSSPKCNPSFSESENNFIRTEIQRLVSIGAVEQTTHEPDEFISSIFVVPKPHGGLRLILNLKELNSFVDCPHFKMEDFRTVRTLMKSNCSMASIDLKDAYLLVPTAETDRKYLKFQHEGILYTYTCVRFGLSTGPRLFTKLLMPVFSKLRSEGQTSVKYLDDIWLMGLDENLCKINVSITLKMLSKLGFMINIEKSSLVPSKRIEYLGFIFDSSYMTLELPSRKKRKILSECSAAIRNKTQSIRSFSELQGLLVSATPAISYSMLYTRALAKDISTNLLTNNENYASIMTISERVLEDLSWWIEAVEAGNSKIRQDTYEHLQMPLKRVGVVTVIMLNRMVLGLLQSHIYILTYSNL